ncbi:TPA: DUF1120 domain-containing protein [Klebsiella aerogenes]|nr:DUF1120 domain-containing protein [Klebsiella aerogenes]
MNKLTKISAATFMFFTVAGQAMAADDNVDVKVTGQIVPPACVPAVSGGAVFDYGVIKAGSLASDDFTVLSKKTLDFSVNCDAAMKIAFKAIDGRSDTKVNPVGKSILDVIVEENTPVYGLGVTSGNKKIGGYRILVFSAQIDGAKKTQGLISHDNGATWKESIYLWMNPGEGIVSSLGDKSSETPSVPAALKTITGKIQIQAAINKGSELDLSKVTNLDGLASIQIVYL